MNSKDQVVVTNWWRKLVGSEGQRRSGRKGYGRDYTMQKDET